MSKELGVILLGIAVVIIPNLGVPSVWRTLLLVIVGSALIVIGLLMHSRGARVGKTSPYQPFVENDAAHLASNQSHESHKEGITSLN